MPEQSQLRSHLQKVFGGTLQAEAPKEPALAKQRVAEAACQYVTSGMKIGLGTGSTASFAVDYLGKALQDRTLKDIAAMPSSEQTRKQAESWGIPLIALGDIQQGRLDLAIDGADEVAPRNAGTTDGPFALIKGGGGAMLRERIVIQSADRFICIVDSSKCSSGLGKAFKLPIEIPAGSAERYKPTLQSRGGHVQLRVRPENGSAYLTDNGNHILDWNLNPDGIPDLLSLADWFKTQDWVLEHGLFIDEATTLIVANDTEVVEF